MLRQMIWPACVIACVGACGSERPAPRDERTVSPAATSQAALPRRDVPIIIYLVDTLRADRLGAYGNKSGLTPTMDRLAKDGVLFEQAYADAPWTLPSVASLMTSQFLTEHGVIEEDRRLSISERPLGKRLSDGGYRCAAFVSNAFATIVTGPECGYERSVLMGKEVDFDQIDQWLESAPRPRVHLFIHTTEPHSPYTASMAWLKKYGNVTEQQRQEVNAALAAYRNLTRVDFVHHQPRGSTDNTSEQDAAMARLKSMLPAIRTLYDAQCAYADLNLKRCIELLKRRGIWDDCIFVLLADHGEELGEHGGWEHDQSLYEELLRVPLIVKFPRNEFAGRQVRTPARVVDIMPTLLDFIGVGDLAGCRGRSLLGLAEGRPEPDFDEPITLAVRSNQRKYYRPYHEHRGEFNVAVRLAEFKGIWNTQPHTFELYDLAGDPLEKNNLAASQRSRAESLENYAKAWLMKEIRGSGAAATQPMSEAAMKRLRELGYIQ